MVNLLCGQDGGSLESNVAKIIRFAGGIVNLVTIDAEAAARPDQIKSVLRQGCVIINSRTLAKICARRGREWNCRHWLRDLSMPVLVAGFEPTLDEGALLRELTSDSLPGAEVISTTGRRTLVADDAKAHDLCQQMTGLSFEAAGPAHQLAFVSNDFTGTCAPLLSIGDKPYLVRLRDEPHEILLLATRTIADLDAVTPRDASLLRYFAGLAPALMFLRSALREHCWRHDEPRACFIVDDPPLKARYGFLDFAKLHGLMKRQQFSTSIAFIPWNHRRSQPAVTELFADASHAFSLCVHGCDHTHGEFGSADIDVLRTKARQALERMESHHALSGIRFDDVMVFPQGIFSTAAMKALQSCGYLAAVNSTPFAVAGEQDLTLRDLLQVAVTRHSDLPLFTRRYPRQLAELAFDLFLGKPALIVEHHQFFRHGYDALAETVERLYAMEKRLRWTNLATICSRACWQRLDDDGRVHVLFCTDRFTLRNETGHARNYVLTRRVVDGDESKRIKANGRHLTFRRDHDAWKAELLLAPRRGVEIEVERTAAEPEESICPRGRMYRAGVFVRRGLSEFRDNYVDRSVLLSHSAEIARSFLPRRADREHAQPVSEPWMPPPR